MISVIIPTKNRKQLLKKAIQSVLMQTYRDFECIIVDDGSTDGTEEAVREFQDSRLRYLRIEEKDSRGGNYARNQGIKNTTGEYVAFVDDDDEWLPDKLRLQKDYLDKNPDVGMVYCPFYKYYVEDNRRQKIVPNLSCRGDCSKRIFTHIPCVSVTMMVRRDILEKVGYFDENLRFWQEYDLCIRICQITKIGYVNKYLAVFRCDKKDKNRLTNNLYDWFDAVKYINRKYAKLIHDLPNGTQKARKIMIYRDAVLRCNNCGSKRAQRYYLGKIYKLSQSKEDFWNWMKNSAAFLE